MLIDNYHAPVICSFNRVIWRSIESTEEAHEPLSLIIPAQIECTIYRTHDIHQYQRDLCYRRCMKYKLHQAKDNRTL